MSARATAAAILGVLAWSCSTPSVPTTISTATSTPSTPTPTSTSTSTPTPTQTPTSTSTTTPTPTPEPVVAPADAERVLYLDASPEPSCAPLPDAERIRCLIDARFRSDPRASAIALDLFARTGDLAGVGREQSMNGGWRGQLHLVPALPVGPLTTHLAWIAEATRDFDAFFAALGEPATQRYRWRAITFEFFRSVRARTPSAYAEGWTIAYNVEGSLNTSADAVRETLFHEFFHLNDTEHGDWSPTALGATYDAIVRRCGTDVACLTPFAPNTTRVRGGTYYAFQPNNGRGVHEYAAELAIRYYREQRAMISGKGRVAPAFKCGAAENRLAWALFVHEFFGDVDRVPTCGG